MNRSTHVSPRVAGAMLPALVAGLASLGETPASAQQLANWTGAIRCEIRAQAEGYSHQETQVWTLTGAAPTITGSVTAYPAAWSVVGRGQHDRTRLSTRRVAQWTASVPSVTAPIGFTLQPGGLRFDVTKWHAQLTGRGGYVGTDQFIQSGVSQASQRLEMTVYEWQFPKIDASTSQTQLTGSNTTEAKAFVGPLQPGEAVATVTCTWALGRGSAPAMPPPALPSADPPVSGTGTPPASSAGPAPATPPVSTPPGATSAPPAAPSSEPLSLALPSGPVTVGISYGSRPALQLGQIAVGSTTTPVSVTLMNTEGVSYGPLYVFGGTPTSAAFGMSQNCQGRTVPVGQSCSVSYTFTPTLAGPATGSSSFWISTTPNQSDGVNVVVSLSGMGILATGTAGSAPAPSGPVTVGISYGSRPALQFGQIVIGSTTTPVSVTLMNTEGVSYGPLYVFGGTPTSAAFAMSQNCQGRTVPVGQSCSVSYTFTPTQAGPVTGSSSFWISTTPNQSDGVNVNVSLSGTGAPARIQP